MYLLVKPNGGKYFRFKYRFAGKEKAQALGVYPEVSLKEAREMCYELRKLIRHGVDPAQVKKEKKRQLAHGERNQIRASYNHAEYLPERREMMQWWADYLDGVANFDALMQKSKTDPV